MALVIVYMDHLHLQTSKQARHNLRTLPAEQLQASTVMQNVGRALEGEELATAPSAQGVSNEDPTYRLLVDCNQLSVDIDGEIAIVHNFMKVGSCTLAHASTTPACSSHEMNST